jgi:ubiquitin thioesterase protein OTUB1
LKLGSKERIDTECDRMLSLAEFIITWRGLADWVFADMRDEALSLLREIGEIVHLGPQPDSSSSILERFNDQSASNSIIYYFRLLASAWLKANAATYQDFIPDLRGVDDYVKDVLEPFSAEIEHLGMTLLVDVLLKPIGISVEIVYLDRSEGTTVNSHVMESPNASQGGAMVHLLYRPGHYDILYKEATRSPPRSAKQQAIITNSASGSSLQVNRATGFTQQHQVQRTPIGDYATADMSVLVDMPIFGASMHGFGEPFTTVSPFDPTPAPAYSIDSPVSSLSPDPGVFPAGPLSMPIHPAPPTHAAPHLHSLSTDLSPASSSGSQFRPSKYEYEPDWNDAGQAQTFQTSTFKNSHYNIAHYNNPNFQPEEWSPDCEEAIGKGRGR